VSGTVTDKKTNAPLDSVTVKLLRSATMTYPTVELELKTDINGKYNFKFSQDDSFGSRAISCYKEGYKPLTNVHVESNIESQVINASLEK
jgi:5-hydroxyisourate hydrolase-like protein (transthyretin family)